MKKILRSLVQEVVPLDARVKLDLISRRRDLLGSEAKKDEILDALREYKVKEVIPIGPGTNRYAFKLNGYLVKAATDVDGKIDNLKEFKMAKILCPDVTKTHEVMTNGLLTVAEYIQVFTSYEEMLKYADKIRAKLRRISSMYLIGDVGISSQNYKNWGIRPGTDDPVCLDFAYTYEVKSKLFICRKCNANAMLFPNDDFTTLICPNCKQESTFEEIRSMISDKEHMEEIGDLTKEGYLLYESNVETTLDSERSNYLIRMKNKKGDSKDHIILNNDNQEEQEMNKEDFEKLTKETEAELRNQDEMNFKTKVVATVRRKNKAVKEIEETPKKRNVTVVSKSELSKKDNQKVIAPVKTGSASIKPRENAPVVQKPIMQEPKTETVEHTSNVSNEVNSNTVNQFLGKSLSRMSNYIKEYLRKEDIYNEIKSSIKDKKMYADMFYRNLQNGIYRSFKTFLNVNDEVVDNVTNYTIPENILDSDVAGTVAFLCRVWIIKGYHVESAKEMMDKYKAMFINEIGIQREWLPVLREKISQKLPIDNLGVDIIVDRIDNMFCQQVEETPVQEDTIVEDPVETIDTESTEEVPSSVPTTYTIDNSIEVESAEPEEDDEYEYEYTDAENDDNYKEYLTVWIYLGDEPEDIDIIRINCGNINGSISIPLYANLYSIDGNREIQSSIDPQNRNGIWEWLTYTTPDLLFRTNDPERWLDVNNDELQEDQNHVAILECCDNGECIMGIYKLSGIYIVDSNGMLNPILDEDLIAKINVLLHEDLGYSRLNPIEYILQNHYIYDENYILEVSGDSNKSDEPEEDEEDEEPEVEERPKRIIEPIRRNS